MSSNKQPFKITRLPLDPIELCEKALHIMLNTSMIKQDNETPYTHGYRNGHDKRKEIDIHIMEKLIEELKKDGYDM